MAQVQPNNVPEGRWAKRRVHDLALAAVVGAFRSQNAIANHLLERPVGALRFDKVIRMLQDKRESTGIGSVQAYRAEDGVETMGRSIFGGPLGMAFTRLGLQHVQQAAPQEA